MITEIRPNNQISEALVAPQGGVSKISPFGPQVSTLMDPFGTNNTRPETHLPEPKLKESSVSLPDGQKVTFHVRNRREVQLLTILVNAYNNGRRIPQRRELFEVLKDSTISNMREAMQKLMQNINQRFPQEEEKEGVENWTIINISPPEKNNKERTYVLITVKELKKGELPYLKEAKFQKQGNKPTITLDHELEQINIFESRQLTINIANEVLRRLLRNEPEKTQETSIKEWLVNLAGENLKDFLKKVSFSKIQKFIINCFKQRTAEVYTKARNRKHDSTIVLNHEESSFYLNLQEFLGRKGLTPDKVTEMIKNLFPENITSSPAPESPEGKDPSSKPRKRKWSRNT